MVFKVFTSANPLQMELQTTVQGADGRTICLEHDSVSTMTSSMASITQGPQIRINRDALAVAQTLTVFLNNYSKQLFDNLLQLPETDIQYYSRGKDERPHIPDAVQIANSCTNYKVTLTCGVLNIIQEYISYSHEVTHYLYTSDVSWLPVNEPTQICQCLESLRTSIEKIAHFSTKARVRNQMAVVQHSRLPNCLTMEPGIRPQSALARGVHITEFKEACVNPDPIVVEETDLLLDQFLSPRKLMLLTGVDNLDDIHHLEIKVNTTDTSLGNFGHLLPNLRQLKVSNSTIPRIRDLGSSLRNLNVIWASRCTLQELDGISSMCNLRELYLSYNEITDISPISMLEQIEVLDLEGNNLDDIVQVQYLAICSKLANLTLEGNPVCVAPTAVDKSIEYDYRQTVKKTIPHLKILDDEPLIEGVGSFQKHNVFDADWAYIEELQKDICLPEENESVYSDSSQPSSGIRPSTSVLRSSAGYHPGSALRPSSGFRPLTSGHRPLSTGARPATALGMRPNSGSKRPSSSSGYAEVSDASDLTMGKVICGNPCKALLSRRRFNPDVPGNQDIPNEEIKFEPKFQHIAEHTYDRLPEETTDRTEIVAELVAWKKEHDKRMEKIHESKAPQILRVDHDHADDAVSLSADSEVESDDYSPDEYSPLRDGDEDSIHKVQRENRIPEEQNCQIMHSVFSFVPVSPSDKKDLPFSKVKLVDVNSHVNSQKNLTNSVLEDSERHSILKTNLSEDLVNISQLASSQKASIPPPKERDIVRKHIDILGHGRAEIPLESLLTQNDVKGIHLGSSLKVNSTGLPRPPSGNTSVMSKNKRETPLLGSSSYEQHVVPLSQRPSTARAALGIPAAQSKIRRQLPTVATLPSKPMAPSK